MDFRKVTAKSIQYLYFLKGMDDWWIAAGGEVAMSSETSDSATLDSKLWPRAAASAERLWAEPTTDSSEAYNRLSKISLYLKKLGLNPEPIFPQWCYQNEGVCKSLQVDLLKPIKSRGR